MNATETSHHFPQARTARALHACSLAVRAAVAAVALAAVAGLALLVIEPAEGSATELVLAGTAAAAGLAGAVLIVGALIVAQVFGLWAHLSRTVRVAATVAIAVALVAGAAGSLI